MTFVVTENCIKCKFTDCVDVCPVDCFHEGPNFLVIDPDECIDCTLCEPECPANAIFAEEDLPDGQGIFIHLNAELSKQWPILTEVKSPMPDADTWNGKDVMLSYSSINVKDEELQAGLVDPSAAIRIRTIKCVKELSYSQDEDLLIDVDASVRLAILKRFDYVLNSLQVERGLIDPNPENSTGFSVT